MAHLALDTHATGWVQRTFRLCLTTTCLWLVCLVASGHLLQAQQPAPPVSPEVHSDGRVTFRIRAPKASTVEVGGDWKPGHLEAMTKDSDGVWSATLGPFEPSIYIYWFTVDGLAIADPVNPRVKLRARTSASLVEVPAKNAGFLATARRSTRGRHHQLAEIASAQRDALGVGVHPARLRKSV